MKYWECGNEALFQFVRFCFVLIYGTLILKRKEKFSLMRIQDCFFRLILSLQNFNLYEISYFFNPGIVHFHIILWYDVTLEFVRRSKDHILWFCWHWFMWFWYYRYFECQSSVLVDQMKVIMKLESYNLGFKKHGNNNFSGAVSETKNIFILWYSNFRKYFN